MLNAQIRDRQAIPHPTDRAMLRRNLISVRDFVPAEIESLFDLASLIKHREADYHAALAGRQVVLFFEKFSLRTRLTFEIAVSSLGGTSFFVDQTRSRLGEREPLSDIAKNVERWVDAVILRTYEHAKILEIADYANVPVVNALSDKEHPCQAFADFFTLQEKFGDLRQVHVAYVGDGNNVAHSLLLAAASLGSRISIATPPGYAPDPRITSAALEIASSTGARLNITHDPWEAVENKDAVYTDVWTSMGCEAEAADRKKIFAGYQVNDELFAHAAPHAVFMHCLPAHREQEVATSVIDSERSVVFDQAENRLHVQKAILLLLLGSDLRLPSMRVSHA